MDKEELRELMVSAYEVLSDPKITDAIAEFTWNLFTKLKEKGFSDEQAISIVTAQMRSSGKK